MVGTPITFDTVLDLCAHEHRRIVLAELATGRSPTFDALTESILEYNHHTAPSAAATDTVSRVETALHHVHLPRLDAAGLVDYDAESRQVEPAAALDQAQPHLSAILDADPGFSVPVEA